MTIQPHDAPVHPAMNPEVDESLARARESGSVKREAALLFAEQVPLSDLLAAATEIRVVDPSVKPLSAHLGVLGMPGSPNCHPRI